MTKEELAELWEKVKVNEEILKDIHERMAEGASLHEFYELYCLQVNKRGTYDD